jgi:hypothetical protein
MPASVSTFAPKDVTLQVNGYTLPSIVSVTLEWTNPPFKMISGIRGATTRVRNKNSSATLSVEFLQTSISNDLLNSIINQDLILGTGRLVVTLSDLSGRSSLMSTQAYVQSRPSVEYSNQANNRVWQFGMLAVEDVEMLGSSNTLKSLFDSGSKYVEKYAKNLIS